jgi:hypothetical protein
LYNEARDNSVVNLGLYAIVMIPLIYGLWAINRYQTRGT